MKTKNRIHTIISVIVLFGFIVSCGAQRSIVKNDAQAINTESQRPTEYIIQRGDQLDIKFFYNPELNETVSVRPDGKISLQLIDDVQAAGLTPSQLDKFLTEKYSQELKKPVVTIIVRSFTGQRVYVGGEVKTQGLIDLAAGMTPLQAVINAGGFMETAKPEGAIIIRKGPDNRPIPIRMDLSNVMDGKGGGADFKLQPSDIVYVPKTFIAKANKFVNQYIERLILFRGVSLGFSYELHAESVY
jgi:protein involved in polysaccharide export with SLBB domain